jgi:hypothetical protein
VRSSRAIREKEKKKTNHTRVWVPQPRIGHLAFGANLRHLPFSSGIREARVHERA